MNDPSTMTFPAARTCPFAPPEEYRQLRESTPIAQVSLPTGGSAWAFTRHEDIRTMLTDPRFSSDRTNPGFPNLVAGQREIAASSRPTMIGMDAPQHGPARRSVLGEFTVKRMKALQPRIQQIVDDCLDAMLAGPGPRTWWRRSPSPCPRWSSASSWECRTPNTTSSRPAPRGSSAVPGRRRSGCARGTNCSPTSTPWSPRRNGAHRRPARPADRETPRGRHLRPRSAWWASRSCCSSRDTRPRPT